MRRVLIESPYAGKGNFLQAWLGRMANLRYARRALREALERGEAPLASALLYTQPGVLDDDDPEERRWGIEAGHAWMPQADAVVFYLDRGMSPGMQQAYNRCVIDGIPIERRLLHQPAGADSKKPGLRGRALASLLDERC